MIQFFNITKTTKWLVSAPDERVAAMINAARCAPLPDWVLRTSSMKPGALAQEARARDDMVFTVKAAPGRQEKASLPPPDGLRTPAEAARKLRCSVKTLNAHVASGALKYVDIGHGKRRQRRMFSDADLNEFIANQTRKDSPCPSSRTHVHRSGVSTSRSEVIAFTARRSGRPGAKRRR